MEQAQAALNPEQINQATQALVQAVNNSAVTGGQTIEANQGQLAAGLNTGSNAVGGYNYARNIAPAVDPLTTSLTLGAQQSIYKQALKDATYQAQENYELAQLAYRARQRAYQEEQARRNRERRERAERQAAAAAQAQAQLAAQRANTGNMMANNGQGGVVVQKTAPVAQGPAMPKITAKAPTTINLNSLRLSGALK